MNKLCELAPTGMNHNLLVIVVAIILSLCGILITLGRIYSVRSVLLILLIIPLAGLVIPRSSTVRAQSVSTGCNTTTNTTNQDNTAEESTLLTGSSLLLRANSVSLPWDGNTWQNEGLLGTDYNAVVDHNFDNGTQKNVEVQYDANYPTGAGFVVQGDDPDNLNEYGFRIANNPLFDIDATSSKTITFDTTPLDYTDNQYKVAWKYAGIALPTFQPGWVLEFNDDIGGGPGSGGLLMAEYDGSTTVGQISQGAISGRHTVSVRIDRNEQTITVFRDGVVLSSLFGNDVSALGDATSAADLLLAKGNVFHNIVVHDRALSDSEISDLYQLLN